jgi:hypothetical protein
MRSTIRSTADWATNRSTCTLSGAAERGWLGPDGHQDVYIERRDLGDRPIEHLDSAE